MTRNWYRDCKARLAHTWHLSVSEWVSEAIIFHDWPERSHGSVLSGCCPFKINPLEWSLCCQGAFHLLWSDCGAVWLKRDNWKPKRSPQAVKYSHRWCYIVSIEILTCHASRWETNKGNLLENTWHYHWVDSEIHIHASCFSLPRHRAATNSQQTDGRRPLATYWFSFF